MTIFYHLTNNHPMTHPALLLAFEAGKWYGQVELEESIDRESHMMSLLECANDRKVSMPLNKWDTLTIDGDIGNTVQYHLRSEKWRAWVRKSAKEYLQDANELLESLYTKQ